MDPLSTFIFKYTLNALLFFLIFIGISSFIDFLEKKYPDIPKVENRFSTFKAFKGAILWPLTLIVITYYCIIAFLSDKKKA